MIGQSHAAAQYYDVTIDTPTVTSVTSGAMNGFAGDYQFLTPWPCDNIQVEVYATDSNLDPIGNPLASGNVTGVTPSGAPQRWSCNITLPAKSNFSNNVCDVYVALRKGTVENASVETVYIVQ